MDYDAFDWWYRCEVMEPDTNGPSDRVRLRFDGLATIAEVWWNGERILESANMFFVHAVDVTDLLEQHNELVLVFRSLGRELQQRRPRPRWKTQLVANQRLRWFRTTLLGRIPGWTPSIQPVGAWRPVWLEASAGIQVVELDLKARVDGSRGVVNVDCTLETLGDATNVTGASVRVGDIGAELLVERSDNGYRIHGEVSVAEPKLWFPRTHGDPALYECELRIGLGDDEVTMECGSVGFRTVEVDRTEGRIHFHVNGVPVFCRGACWTTNDLVTLVGSEDSMRRTLELAAASNANMVRVGGTMVYESDGFYRECDRLGIMVWQDFMFANMDYPTDDPSFREAIRHETHQQLRRLSRHPSVVSYCGGSEVEQQAAMFGAPSDAWSNDFFSAELPELVAHYDPGAPYWSSTPTGGALPFHVGEGLAHYYGVGAYRRPLEDARLAGVRFTPECLGFSNVPEPDNLRALTPDGSVPPQHPAWKLGVPRDGGASWDFEDIRDHYLEELYRVDPARLRAEDPERYLRLSREATGRVMARVFDEWRSSESGCGGGLIWFLKDLRPGAGWGIVDSDNRPKPVFFYLRRAWAPVRISILERGLDGLRIEVHNERPHPLRGELQLTVVDERGTQLATATRSLGVPGRETVAFNLEEILGYFLDPTYSYRFGPRRHAAVRASLIGPDAEIIAEDIYWPSLDASLPPTDLKGAADPMRVSVSTSGPARSIRLDVVEGLPEDNYFDLLPDRDRRVGIDGSSSDSSGPSGYVEASNAPLGARITGRS